MNILKETNPPLNISDSIKIFKDESLDILYFEETIDEIVMFFGNENGVTKYIYYKHIRNISINNYRFKHEYSKMAIYYCEHMNILDKIKIISYLKDML
jgi:hypothetical protein